MVGFVTVQRQPRRPEATLKHPGLKNHEISGVIVVVLSPICVLVDNV